LTLSYCNPNFGRSPVVTNESQAIERGGDLPKLGTTTASREYVCKGSNPDFVEQKGISGPSTPEREMGVWSLL
jgi:hypothetical protein